MGNVTIGCKLPHGLIIHHPGFAESVTLKGANARDAISGFGLTSVDADFAEAWYELYGRSHPAVRNGLIFVSHGDYGSAVAEAGEKSATKTGLEPLNPDAPGAGLTAADKA